MLQEMQPATAVAYYTLTEPQLQNLINESVTKTLEGLGLTLNPTKTKLVGAKDEYKPVKYWLKELNVNRVTLWRWQKEGFLRPTRIGRKLFFCQADFDKMFAKKATV